MNGNENAFALIFLYLRICSTYFCIALRASFSSVRRAVRGKSKGGKMEKSKRILMGKSPDGQITARSSQRHLRWVGQQLGNRPFLCPLRNMLAAPAE